MGVRSTCASPQGASPLASGRGSPSPPSKRVPAVTSQCSAKMYWSQRHPLLNMRGVSAGSARATFAPGTPLRRAPHVESGVPQGAHSVREWGALRVAGLPSTKRYHGAKGAPLRASRWRGTPAVGKTGGTAGGPRSAPRSNFLGSTPGSDYCPGVGRRMERGRACVERNRSERAKIASVAEWKPPASTEAQCSLRGMDAGAGFFWLTWGDSRVSYCRLYTSRIPEA